MLLAWLGLFGCENEKIVPQTEEEVVTLVDLDGDGYLDDVDCDDGNASVYPNALEVCDGIDNNCDSEIDEDVQIQYFADGDGDGFGNSEISVMACSASNGFVPNGNDCDDTEPTVFPGASELCDGLDNDCNAIVDDGNDLVVYQDADGDGYGDPDVISSACTAGDGFVDNYLDCNDQNNTIHPNADEMCDNIDNNCDGLIDNEALDAPEWYRDADGDGSGTDTETINTCLIQFGYAAEGNDCDDTNPDMHPFAEEICDQIDQDCDGLVDEGTNNTFFEDADGDGFGNFYVYIETCTPTAGYVSNGQDCNDTNPDVSPNALEYCNGYDDNCDGMTDENTAEDVQTWYADVDGDGFGDAAVPVEACSAPPFYVGTIGDCDDGRPNVNPSATETCTTAYDDDCNGNNNDDGAIGCFVFFEDVDGDGYGQDASSQCTCVPEGDFQTQADGDCDDTLVTVNPGMLENCTTAYDDNCNTDLNEQGAAGCTYFYQDYDGDQYGTSDRVCMCEPVADYEALIDGDCDDLNALYSPDAIEVCDTDDVDENCDGEADGADAVGAVDWFLDGDLDGYGNPNNMLTQCDQPTGYITEGGDCADTIATINPGEQETCYTLDDDDCSGTNNDPNSLGCSTFFLDNDADGYGLASDTQCLCSAEAPYSSVTSGDCDDSTDAISPGRQETCDTSDDEDCDGVVDEPNAENCTVYHYDFDGDNYGIGSDSICLCDVDGYYRAPIGGDCVDIDIGINPGLGNCGLTGLIPREDSSIVISGMQVGASTQQNFIGEFDYNNDGIDDIAVLDPEFDTQYINAGALFIFLGPLDSSVDISSGTQADLMFSPERASEYLGRYSGISVGNWDADAADEIIVSGVTQSYVIDDNLQGQVSITDANAGVTTFSSVNIRSSSSYDEGMAFIGDINQDGYSDVLRQVGYDVTLFFSDGVGNLTDSGQTMYQYSSHPMVSIRNAVADLNNDGVVEWIGMGRHCDGNSSTYTDLCIKQYDSGNAQFSTQSISGVGHYEYGRVTIGDFNADGYDDIVSAYLRYNYYDLYRGTLQNSGQVWVFYGGPNGITATTAADADWTAYGNNFVTNSSLQFGRHLSTADVNGDGVDDLLVGSAKGSFIFYGPLQSYTDAQGDPRVANSSDADAIFPRLASQIRDVGDQNQDGYDDVLVGGSCSYSDQNDNYNYNACGTEQHNLYLFMGASTN